MDLELESEYFWQEFFDDEFVLAPFKKEVCLGIICPDDVIGDLLADNFCDIGYEVFVNRKENPTKPYCMIKPEGEYEDYISFFFYIDEAEIMSFSVPMEYNTDKLFEKVEPAFRNFWETYFEKIMEVRRYNRKTVEKFAKKNTAAAASLIYGYYCKIEMDQPEKKFFWLKKWASRSFSGKKALLRYYRFHHDYVRSKKLERLIRGDRERDF